uniref:U1 small nuclear ribonucleoprotein n=1 Tax=Rhizophora mucronata TaxID=61149 RepID=A0A2P2IIW3_RHIMU
MPVSGQLPMNPPFPGIRPPVLPRPLPGAPGMTTMVAPPGAPTLPGQVNGVPRPPTATAPPTVPGSMAPPVLSSGAPSMVGPATYRAPPATSASGSFDNFNVNARAPEVNH